MSQHVITYTTSGGRTYDLSGPPRSRLLLAWSSAISRWELSAQSDGDAGLVSRPLEFDVSVYAPRDEMGEFLEACSRDARGDGGTLSADGWVRRCKARSCSYDRAPSGWAAVSMTMRSTDQLWRRTRSYDLMTGNVGSGTVTTGLDLPTDYPFDLAGTSTAMTFRDLEAGSSFLVRSTFFGPCVSPYVFVTSRGADGAVVTNRYGVDASADVGERIVIDPLGTDRLGASVYKVGAYGERSNLFDRRLRGVDGSGTYVFQRMPVGSVSAAWPQSYGVTLDIIEERGSLPWS